MLSVAMKICGSVIEQIDLSKLPKLRAGDQTFRKQISLDGKYIITKFEKQRRVNPDLIPYVKAKAEFPDGHIIHLGYIPVSEFESGRNIFGSTHFIEGWSLDSISELLNRMDFAVVVFASENQSFYKKLLQFIVREKLESKNSERARRILEIDRKAGHGFRNALLHSFFQTKLGRRQMTEFMTLTPEFLVLDTLRDIDLQHSELAHNLLHILYEGFIKEKDLSKPISKAVLRMLLYNGHRPESHIKSFIVHQVPRDRLIEIFEFLKNQGNRGLRVLCHLLSAERIFMTLSRERFQETVSMLLDGIENVSELASNLHQFNVLSLFRAWHFVEIIQDYLKKRQVDKALNFIRHPAVMEQMWHIFGKYEYRSLVNFLNGEIFKLTPLEVRKEKLKLILQEKTLANSATSLTAESHQPRRQEHSYRYQVVSPTKSSLRPPNGLSNQKAPKLHPGFPGLHI